MISYYELLGMIKEDKAPEKIRVHLTQMTSRIYVRENDLDDTFSYYGLLNENEENDEYKYYLSDCLLESSMFDKNIEIIEDKPKEETNVSEEQVLFNKLSYEEQQFILKQMRMLQPCELECEKEEKKKIPEKLDIQIQNETTGNAYITNEQGTKCYLTKHSKIIAERLNQVIDYLKSKGE